MMGYKEKIGEYIKSHKTELVDTLKDLVRIPSVRGESEENAPFGKECAKVLEFAESLYKANGFETELDGKFGYLLSYCGRGEKALGLFAHADVVPAAEDWILSEPFEPAQKDGFLIGRGTLDDKSAIVISLYCAKMLKELDIPFNSRLVCFTGANEETGMADIKAYAQKHKAPDFSLVCDTAFPLYRGNKAMLQFTAVCDALFDGIKYIIASNARGAIIGEAIVKLDYSEELYKELKASGSENLVVTQNNDEIIIKAYGISKHTALPENSVNAAGMAFEALAKCNSVTEKERHQAKFIAELLNGYYGEYLGIENMDADFGRLTFANDMLHFEDGKIKLHFNLRFGACVDISELKEKISVEFSSYGWNVVFEAEASAYSMDINHPMLRACLKAYKEYTKDDDAPVYINAGGTYARHLPCAAEIGTTTRWGGPKGLPQGHGAVHQPDECISIEGMLEALELTMLMLIECDKENMQNEDTVYRRYKLPRKNRT